MLLRLPLNLVGKLLQSVLSGRGGAEPAQVLFLAQGLRKQEAKYFIRDEESDNDFWNDKGKCFRDLSMTGKIVKCVHKAPCRAETKPFCDLLLRRESNSGLCHCSRVAYVYSAI